MMATYDKLIIHPYSGFGSETDLYLKGRVLREKGIAYSPERNPLRNFHNMYKRFASRESGSCLVQINHNDQQWLLPCDSEGYYELDRVSWNPSTSPRSKTELDVHLLHPDQKSIIHSTKTSVYQPDSQSGIALVVDIDDTIMHTGAGERAKLSVIFNTMFTSAIQRRTVEGIPRFLDNLTLGQKRPVFYLSNSPWNLYNYLNRFITLNKLPKGPVLLRDYGWHLLMKKELREKHKFTYLKKLFNMFPNLSFILIGDTTSDDAHFYLEIQEQFNQRVKAIYLREPRPTRRSNRLRDELNKLSDPRHLLFSGADDAQKHAEGLGLMKWI